MSGQRSMRPIRRRLAVACARALGCGDGVGAGRLARLRMRRRRRRRNRGSARPGLPRSTLVRCRRGQITVTTCLGAGRAEAVDKMWSLPKPAARTGQPVACWVVLRRSEVGLDTPSDQNRCGKGRLPFRKRRDAGPEHECAE